MNETIFKKRIFVSLLCSNLIVLLWLSFEWSSFGFSTLEYIATSLLALFPFSIYFLEMRKSYVKIQYEEQFVSSPKIVSKFVSHGAFIFTFIYTAFIIYLAVSKSKGIIGFSELQILVALAAMVFGNYIRNIVNVFFREEPQKEHFQKFFMSHSRSSSK